MQNLVVCLSVMNITKNEGELGCMEGHCVNLLKYVENPVLCVKAQYSYMCIANHQKLFVCAYKIIVFILLLCHRREVFSYKLIFESVCSICSS